MMQPSDEIYTLLYKAAQTHRVPLTILEALAFEGSGFDPKKKTEKAGQPTRYGLFGLPFERASFALLAPSPNGDNAVDAMDATQATEAVARAIAEIMTLTQGAGGEFVFGVWRDGSKLITQHGIDPKAWPTESRRYVEKMVRIRYWFQDRGMPRGASRLEHLEDAIKSLANLNTGLHPLINAARDALTEYKASSTPDPFFHGLQVVWLAYAKAFDTAPITTDRTPVPERIEPDWWRATNNALQPSISNLGSKLEDAAKSAGEAISNAAFIGLAVSSALAALWIVVNRRKA